MPEKVIYKGLDILTKTEPDVKKKILLSFVYILYLAKKRLIWKQQNRISRS